MVRNNTDTKNKIIQSAIDIISLKGFSAATTHEIAKAAGYSEATIFKYFVSKKGLLDAIVQKLIENIADSVGLESLQAIINNTTLTFEERMDLVLENRIRFVERNFELIKILIVEIQFHEDVRNRIIDQILKPVLRDLSALVQSEIEKGHIIKVDPMILMRTFFSGIFISILPNILLNKPLDTAVLKKELETVKNIYLHGILTKENN